MAKMQSKLPVSKETMFRMLLCVGFLLALALLVVLPAFQQSRALDVSIAERKVEISEQEILFPVYAQFASELKKDRAESLPVPDIVRLGQDELAGVIQSIEKSAADAGFKVITVNPDPESLEDGRGLLLVNCRFQGPFTTFRDVIISLGSIPHVKYISRIQAKEAYENAEFEVELQLAMKDNVAS